MAKTTLASYYPSIFARIFDGTFTGVLSGLLCSIPDFEVAWKKAANICDDIEVLYGIGITVPDSTTPGIYYSHSGKMYILEKSYRKNQSPVFSITFPEDTSFVVDELITDDIWKE